MKSSLSLAFLLGLLLPTALPAQTNSLPPNPRLLLNADGLALLKQRIAAAPWATRQWAELKANAERQLDKPIVLPPRGGNWSHNYVCPEHGARLVQGAKIGPWQWEHICPVGNHVLHGDPSQAVLDFDGVVLRDIHQAYATEVIDHGLVYQLTGDLRHARKAREILLAYADRYLSYPLHDNQGKPGKGGHVASQSLTEATWLIDFVQGADLVWSTLSADDRRAITDKVLLPALNETIRSHPLGIHNIQCRHNSAIGLVGFLIGDQKLISEAIDGEYGFRAQMEQGVLDDGMWHEGSSGYHYFTIAGLWPLAEAARNCGIDLYGRKFHSMFDGPLSLAMPNFSLPNFNDSGIVPLQSEADFYELAFARFHDPVYASIISPGNRRGRLALLYGETNLTSAALTAPNTHNSPASGYAIIERGTGDDATWLGIKYGPHGGGHGHPDKNHFILYAHGDVLAPDAGTHAYGSPLHAGWDKTTLAHNTLLMDETSQEPAQGKCIAFGSQGGVDYSITDAGPIYPGVRFIRTAAMLSQGLVLFVDQVQASEPHTFDIAYHQFGAWQDLPPGSPWSSPSHGGFRYFTRTTVRPLGGDCLTLKTRVNDREPAIVIAGGDSTQIITGYGILKTTEDHVPLVLQRRKAQRTAFVWAVSVDGTPVKLAVSDVSNPAGVPLSHDEALLVRVTNHEHGWSVLVNPSKKDVSATSPGGQTWRSTDAISLRD